MVCVTVKMKELTRTDPPCRAKGLSHKLGTLPLRSSTRKMSLLGWFENQWGYQRADKELRLFS